MNRAVLGTQDGVTEAQGAEQAYPKQEEVRPTRLDKLAKVQTVLAETARVEPQVLSIAVSQALPGATPLPQATPNGQKTRWSAAPAEVATTSG